MDILKEDKQIIKNGGLKSAFLWSLLAFPIIFLLNMFGGLFLIFDRKIVAVILVFFVIPNVVLFLVYYFALKTGIKKFKLNNYTLRLEYVAIITFLVLIYFTLLLSLLYRRFYFPEFGIISLCVMLLTPYFVKSGF